MTFEVKGYCWITRKCSLCFGLLHVICTCTYASQEAMVCIQEAMQICPQKNLNTTNEQIDSFKCDEQNASLKSKCQGCWTWSACNTSTLQSKLKACKYIKDKKRYLKKKHPWFSMIVILRDDICECVWIFIWIVQLVRLVIPSVLTSVQRVKVIKQVDVFPFCKGLALHHAEWRNPVAVLHLTWGLNGYSTVEVGWHSFPCPEVGGPAALVLSVPQAEEAQWIRVLFYLMNY